MTSLVRKIINTQNAAKPVAPYSQAVVADRTVYVSGCLGLEIGTNKMVDGGIRSETLQALTNLQAILKAAGSSIEQVIKVTIFVLDIGEFSIVNEEYKKVFTHDFPARTCVQAAKLPMNASVLIECVALTGDFTTIVT